MNALPLRAEQFLSDPGALRQVLTDQGALDFKPYTSGLYPASDLPADAAEATGMGFAWLRDNAHVGNALFESDDRGGVEAALAVGQAMLNVLHENRDVLDDVAADNRLPVRVDGDTLAPDTEPRVQHDATGYALWFTSKLLKHRILPQQPKDIDIIVDTARYLGRIEYWQDPDHGHWEEDARIHASSIGTALAGIRSAITLCEQTERPQYLPDLRRYHDQGRNVLHNILDHGLSDLGDPTAARREAHRPYSANIVQPHPAADTHFAQFSPHLPREHDAALLFLVEPLQLLDPERAAKVVGDVKKHLVRDQGVIRYPGDTYWGPRFDDIMSIEERTRAAEGRTEARNQLAEGNAYAGVEAQWTIFDPNIAAYEGRRYLLTHDKVHFENQLHHINRSLRQLVATPDGRLLWPEARYLAFQEVQGKKNGSNRWIPNDHMPLLWTQANALRMLTMFERTVALSNY